MVAVLLTARGNNTLKDKNLLGIGGGYPVIYYPAKAGIDSKTIERHFVSSDDEKILDFAHEMGYEKIKRPDELALPSSQHIETIAHGLNVMNERNVFPEILVVTLGNNITINSKMIDDCVDVIKNDMTLSSCVPVYKDNDHHPLRCKRINEDGYLYPFFEAVGKVSTNRQDLESCYYLCHNFWVLNVKMFNSWNLGQPPWLFMGNKIAPYIVENSIDIHNEFDLRVAKEWLAFKNEI